MSKKNCANSDLIAKSLDPVPTAVPPYAPQTTTVALSGVIATFVPLFSFTAKKLGYVRVACNFSAGVVPCKLGMLQGRTATALGAAIPYTQQPVVPVDGYGDAHYVIPVVAGVLYDLLATSAAAAPITSGLIMVEYL